MDGRALYSCVGAATRMHNVGQFRCWLGSSEHLEAAAWRLSSSFM